MADISYEKLPSIYNLFSCIKNSSKNNNYKKTTINF